MRCTLLVVRRSGDSREWGKFLCPSRLRTTVTTSAETRDHNIPSENHRVNDRAEVDGLRPQCRNISAL